MSPAESVADFIGAAVTALVFDVIDPALCLYVRVRALVRPAHPSPAPSPSLPRAARAGAKTSRGVRGTTGGEPGVEGNRPGFPPQTSEVRQAAPGRTD